MFLYIDRLSPEQQGIVALIFGTILLLFTLGLFQSMLSFIIILAALALIVSGFVQSGLYKKVMALAKKKKH